MPLLILGLLSLCPLWLVIPLLSLEPRQQPLDLRALRLVQLLFSESHSIVRVCNRLRFVHRNGRSKLKRRLKQLPFDSLLLQRLQQTFVEINRARFVVFSGLPNFESTPAESTHARSEEDQRQKPR